MKLPEPSTSWGIFGGQFDPIHHGHLNLARELMTAKNLSGVLFVPSISHPFKSQDNSSTFADRFEMLKIALNNQPDMTPSRIEQEENLSGYTVDTLTALIQRYQNTQFYFIIGADNLGQLKRWKEPEKIIKLVKLLAGNRQGAELICPQFIDESKIEFVTTSNLNISSTTIRENIKAGHDLKQTKAMLHPEVYDYIILKGLYLND